MAFNPADSDLLISAGRPDQFPSLSLPQVAFSGRSNVGKSSLINTLLGRKSLARVSSMPGKTVTVNFYKVSGRLLFADLPGYGFARRAADDKEKWSSLTDGFFTKNRNIDRLKLTVQLVDLTVGPTDDDLMMIGYMKTPVFPSSSSLQRPTSPTKPNARRRLSVCGATPVFRRVRKSYLSHQRRAKGANCSGKQSAPPAISDSYD